MNATYANTRTTGGQLYGSCFFALPDRKYTTYMFTEKFSLKKYEI